MDDAPLLQFAGHFYPMPSNGYSTGVVSRNVSLRATGCLVLLDIGLVE
jgi:hypothetical protein